MRKILGSTIAALALVLAGCGSESSDVANSQQAAKAAAKPTNPSKDSQLNLSHIECEGERVNAHFVLLFGPADDPPGIVVKYTSGGDPITNAPVAAEPVKTGNVWHYNVTLPSGYIEVLDAWAGETALHNPGEYTGIYTCGNPPDTCEELDGLVEGAYCSKPGNPGSECGRWGLTPFGKDDNLSGQVFTATMDAAVALVKSGAGECTGQGESGYNLYIGVNEGDLLETPYGQDISHVTYCVCPKE
jgi:hypothetical protein